MKKSKKVALISETILKNLINISNNSELEECGIFIGEFNGKEIFIKDIVQDKKNEFGTIISTIRQTKNIYKEYQSKIIQDYTNDYIGEWHTHPLGSPTLSNLDNQEMNFLINHPKYGNPKELILGIINPKEGIKIYLYKFKKDKPREVVFKKY